MCLTFIGKAKRCFRDWPLIYFFGDFISRLFGDYTNIHMWKSGYMKAWNSIKNDCDRFVNVMATLMKTKDIKKRARNILQ